MDTNGARAYSTPGEQEPSATEALHRLQEQVGALQAYLTHFLSAKLDGMLLTLRQIGMWAVLGVVGLIALAALLVTALVLVMAGAATALGLLLGGHLWLGQLVVGGGVLILLVVGLMIGIRTWQGRARQQKVHDYDERQLQQRAAYGHSVADRARDDATLQQGG